MEGQREQENAVSNITKGADQRLGDVIGTVMGATEDGDVRAAGTGTTVRVGLDERARLGGKIREENMSRKL